MCTLALRPAHDAPLLFRLISAGAEQGSDDADEFAGSVGEVFQARAFAPLAVRGRLSARASP